MSQNATQDDTLSASQLLALRALMQGCNVTDAAAVAKVDRATVHRWLRQPEFLAQFNAAKRQHLVETRAQLAITALRAADTVDKAVSGGNVQAALAVLRGLGLLDGALHIGSDDPQELRDAAEQAALMRALSRI